MGASGWEYRTPYEGSPGQSLRALQEGVLASGDFIWPWDDLGEDELEGNLGMNAGERRPRPTTLAELASAKDEEAFWEVGTHSILDMHKVADSPGAQPATGVVRPLTPIEVTQVFGRLDPSPGDLDAVIKPGPAGPLADLMDDRWTGRCVVVHEVGQPIEVCFWGYSGD